MATSFDIVSFVPSDGLTPLQAQKLNANFMRLSQLVAQGVEGAGAEAIASQVEERVASKVLDLAWPIGSLVLAKDASCLPRWGLWREVDDADGRFVRIGDFGSTGGSASQVVRAGVKEHSHSYLKQTAGSKVKVKSSTDADAKEVVATLADATQPSQTGKAGDAEDQVISTVPPFFGMRLFERYE